MCGRYTLIDLAKFTNIFPWLTPPGDVQPRYNIAPSQEVAVVANVEPRRLEFFRWGLVPHWAQDPKIGNRMINARGETLAEKPAFRDAFRRRRCAILADGFYEWQQLARGQPKSPYYIRMKGGKPFLIAGLWDVWRGRHTTEQAEDPQQKLLSCTIVTGPPNELVRPIHDRMPMILPLEQIDLWLSPEAHDPAALNPLLQPFPAAEMEAIAVSRLVNDPHNESPQCIEPWR